MLFLGMTYVACRLFAMDFCHACRCVSDLSIFSGDASIVVKHPPLRLGGHAEQAKHIAIPGRMYSLRGQTLFSVLTLCRTVTPDLQDDETIDQWLLAGDSR